LAGANRARRRWVRLAATLSALILLGALFVSLDELIPLTFRSSATLRVGLSQAERSDLIATFCITAAGAANSGASRAMLAGLVVAASLDYANRHRPEVDPRLARSMMHAALAAAPQQLTIAKMCQAAGHPIAAPNPEIRQSVAAATAAAAPVAH
jgi:hypothetical protein